MAAESCPTPTATMRTLRKITAYIALPALPMIIPTAVKGYPLILLGLAPLAVSIALQIHHACANRRGKPVSLLFAAFLDLVAMLGYFGVLMPMWTGKFSALHRLTGWRWHNSRTHILILFGYASSIYVANMAMHLVTCALDVYVAAPWKVGFSGPKYCSRCRSCPRCRGEDEEETKPMMQKSVDNGAQYSLLGDVEDQTPRASEETVREV